MNTDQPQTSDSTVVSLVEVDLVTPLPSAAASEEATASTSHQEAFTQHHDSVDSITSTRLIETDLNLDMSSHSVQSSSSAVDVHADEVIATQMSEQSKQDLIQETQKNKNYIATSSSNHTKHSDSSEQSSTSTSIQSSHDKCSPTLPDSISLTSSSPQLMLQRC
jgi:hypothetical protein